MWRFPWHRSLCRNASVSSALRPQWADVVAAAHVDYLIERSDTRGARQAAIWAIALCNDTTNQIVSIAWACVSSDSD